MYESNGYIMDKQTDSNQDAADMGLFFIALFLLGLVALFISCMFEGK